MKRLFQIFELSKNEQRVVLIIMLILVTIAFVAYERRVRHSLVESALATEPKPSPTAVETARGR
jgi:ABC-type Fe3+ transport system permease subunit